MSDNSAIEWTRGDDGTAGATWNPILGCRRVSPGCDSCYAIPQARIREANPNPKIAAAFAGLVERRDGRLDWTGRVNLLPERLTQPLRWRKPRRVFVNSLADMFHDDVPTEFIARVFAVMAATLQHTYQILTKRHARMRSLLRDECRCGSGHAPSIHLRSAMAWAASKANPDRIPGLPDDAEHYVYFDAGWPLPNVWLGVSVEDQKWADIRVPALLDTPAAVRFLSCEPLLGPLDLSRWMGALTCGCGGEPGGAAFGCSAGCMEPVPGGIHWVITGGESGPKSRPAHPDWFRQIRDQCQAAGAAYFFKQWGEYGPMCKTLPDGRYDLTDPGISVANDGTVYHPGDLTYPDGPRYGEAIRARHDHAHLTAMYRVGKKAAGRELDGREWNEFPPAKDAAA